jgi:hypothetical protein
MKYSITNTGSSWLLKIWEPSPVTGDRILPYLYKIKSVHSTLAEAKEALAWHQSLNKRKEELAI